MSVNFKPTQIFTFAEIPNRVGIRMDDSQTYFGGNTGTLRVELVDYQNNTVIEVHSSNNYSMSTSNKFSYLFETELESTKVVYVRFIFVYGNDTCISTTPILSLANGKYFPTFCLLTHPNGYRTRLKVCCSGLPSGDSNVRVTYKIGQHSESVSASGGIPKEHNLDLTDKSIYEVANNKSEVISVTVLFRDTGDTFTFNINFNYWYNSDLVIVSDLLCFATYNVNNTVFSTITSSAALWARGNNVAYKLGILQYVSATGVQIYLNPVPRYILQGNLNDYLFIFYEYKTSNHELLSVVDLGKR